ncbi:hypothetical protein HAX54_029917, partial [Datura stramonium]|nr:hypothetical protein [Datura stramonium]
LDERRRSPRQIGANQSKLRCKGARHWSTAGARQRNLRHKGRVDTLPFLSSMWVRDQEVNVTPEAINSLYWAKPIQPNLVFSRKVEDKENQDTTQVPLRLKFSWLALWIIHISMLEKSLRINSKGRPSSRKHHCLIPAFHWIKLEAEGVITLDTKIDKDAPASTRSKGMGDRINPPPSVFSSTTAGSSQATVVTASLPTDLLIIAQMAQAHESQIIKLAKAILSMIQQAIKKAIQPAKDKLRGLCAKAEVLENDLISLRKDVARHADPLTSINKDLH